MEKPKPPYRRIRRIVEVCAGFLDNDLFTVRLKDPRAGGYGALTICVYSQFLGLRDAKNSPIPSKIVVAVPLSVASVLYVLTTFFMYTHEHTGPLYSLYGFY